MSTSPSEKQVVTVLLEQTDATRRYPFARKTLDQIKELREYEEGMLLKETGTEHQVPAPVIIANAIATLHQQTFKEA